MNKRKQIEDKILSTIKKIDPKSDNINIELYKNMFKSMSDKEFSSFMDKLANDEITLQYIVEKDKEKDFKLDNLIKLAKSLGVKIFSKLKIKSDKLPPHTTKSEYMILNLPVKALKQTLDKGLAVAENIKNVNTITGQVIGDSKVSKMTLPELHILNSMGLEKTMSEILKDRGGDNNATNILINSLLLSGKASEADFNIVSLRSRDKSNYALKAYLRGMMLKDNI